MMATVKSGVLSGVCWLVLCVLVPWKSSGEDLTLSVTNEAGRWSLSWPAWAADGVLEESTNLQPFGSWTPVSPGAYQSAADAFHYGFSPREGNRFFRLRRVGPPVSGLVGCWSFDGVETAAAGQTSPVPALYMTNVAWAAGRLGGGSLQFNGGPGTAGGSFAWASNANYQLLPPAGLPFSVSLWLNPVALPVGMQEILGNESDGSAGWRLSLNAIAPGRNYLVLSGAGTASSLNLTGQTLLLPGQWHQLTLTYGTNGATLYLDSRPLAQGPGSLRNSQQAFYLGATLSNGAGFQGRLDEVRIYTSALSQEQISVTGQWHFDEGAGVLAADSSIQGHPAALVTAKTWSGGKTNWGVDLSAGPVVIANDDYSVLPATGGPFSVSFWMQPRQLFPGRSALLSCAEGSSSGWQLTLDVEDSLRTWIEFTSTNLGGTLALQAPLNLTNGAWTKLDLTYNGGVATVYVNGSELASDQGAIEAVPAPLMLGAAPGAMDYNGVVDELKVYNRERQPAEIGPVAQPMWETALMNTTTKLVLQGAGPPGRLLTYSILSAPAPSRGSISYSPGSPLIAYQAGGKKGPDSFVFTVSDGEFISPPATAAVSVVQPHWLSPAGGALLPLDGSAPRHAWAAGKASALDAIWKTNNYYDCFFYSPGTFQTTGWKYLERSTANPGCKHIGAGSEGPNTTTLQLVDAWQAWGEGRIFGPSQPYAACDDFEVRNLVLDCNAQNNPKYTVGQSVWLHIPLTTTARVDQVTLHWSAGTVAGTSCRLGRPAQFTIYTRTPGAGGFLTNSLPVTSTGQVDVVSVGAQTDQLLVELTRRAGGVDFYGLAELEVAGALVSLPSALIPGGGESALDGQHSILRAIDGDPETSWASGPEGEVQITLPLAAGTRVSQINFQWNCQTLTNLLRLGPAVGYLVYAHDATTGQFVEVPFVSHGRGADGQETVTFGTLDVTNAVTTDQLTISLIAREPGVDCYSLREVSLQNGPYPAALRVPGAIDTLVWGQRYSLLNAFDHDLDTQWASGTQGSVTAFGGCGSNMKFCGLKVIHFGTKAGRECFPLAVLAPRPWPGHPEPFRNVLVEDCAFLEPATNNSDGLTAVAVAGHGSGSLLNAVVRRCSVVGVKSYFSYSHGFGATWVEDSRVEDCQYGVYFEPNPDGADSLGPVMLRSNQFLNVTFGISVDFHPGAHFDTLQCLDNEIVLTGASQRQGYGIRLCDICVPGPSGTLTNLVALNNIIRYPDWRSRPASVDGGLIYTDIRHAIYGNNVIALGNAQALRVRPYPAGVIPNLPPPEDCDHPGLISLGVPTYPPSMDPLRPGYRRAWFNNRDLSGALLPVRFYEQGVDRLASQQQWP